MRIRIFLFITITCLSSATAMAQAKKAGESKPAPGRKKILTTEGRTTGSNKTNIDFDAAAIDGERRLPAGVNVGGAKEDNNYDLINPRLTWHPEMIKSTSNIETGKQ